MHTQIRYYLGAHGGKILVWQAYDLLFAYFLTRGLRLAPETMGIATMALMLFGAVADPVAGWLIGRGPDTAARLARLQLWGALLCAVAFPALFWAPGWLAPLPHALCLGLLFQVCYKLYDVPQNALTSVLSHDNAQVLQLTSGRYLLSAAARILVVCAAYVLVGDDGRDAPAGAMMLFAAALSVPAALSACCLARVLRTRSGEGDGRRPAAAASPRLRARLPARLPMLVLAVLVNAGMVSVMGRMLPYLGTRSHALVAFALGALLFLPPFRHWAARFGEHVAFGLATLVTVLACIGLSLACRLDGAGGALLLDVFAFAYGGGAFGCTMLLWGAAANLIHRHHADTALRADTLSYGIFSFASKAGIALSMLALGYVLGPLALSGSTVSADVLDAAAALGVLGSLASAAIIYRTLRWLGRPLQPEAPYLGAHGAAASLGRLST